MKIFHVVFVPYKCISTFLYILIGSNDTNCVSHVKRENK